MNYAAWESAPGLTATLVTDVQSAWRVADSFTEGEFADDVAVSLVDVGPGQSRVTLYFRGPMIESLVRDLTISAAGLAAGDALAFARIPRKDWVLESLHELKPVTAGRFVVHGAHDRGCAPANRIGIEVEASQAFGTGHHGTTLGCLLALDAICKRAGKDRPMRVRHPEVRANGSGPKWPARWQAPRASKDAGPKPKGTLRGSARRTGHLRVTRIRRILDLGTGSGVLAIAAAQSLRRRVLATDIDVLAVRIARDNARLNRVGGLLCVRRAEGIALPELRARAPYDLVLANILLTPLQKLASPLSMIVAPGGRIVLAGLLKSQLNAALASYRRFTLQRRIELDGWTTLILRRK